MAWLDHKTIVITGGTGSLGRFLTLRLLSGACGAPKKVIVFSRDEAKQHAMRLELKRRRQAGDPVGDPDLEGALELRIGDVRDFHAVCAVLKNADLVVNAAALKQVPTCEYFPFEAVQTNILGAENVVRAIRERDLHVEAVVGVSTDKACKPVNVMGMTKALQERLLIAANLTAPDTRFVCVRYGNVLASRGSVIPLFHDQIRSGGPVTITSPEMTRFLLPLSRAVDAVLGALEAAQPGETVVPCVPSARIVDVAAALVGDRDIPVVVTGIRPGEKVHEVLVSAEEATRTVRRGEDLAIFPMLPELTDGKDAGAPLGREYSSADTPLSPAQTRQMLLCHHLMVDQATAAGAELLR
jgi:FlaA1/EpsC-like NDP-sugar epimerase